MKTILVVDDEPKIAALARDYLEHAGFAVVTAADGRAAIEAVGRAKPDLVVLDLGLPALDAPLAADGGTPELDEATREHLRALGYAE